MTKDEDLEVLQIAIKTEEDGLRLFKELAKKVQLQMAKDTFKSLAAQEMDHIMYIQEFYKSLKAGATLKNVDYLIKKQKSEREKMASVFTKALSSLKDQVSPTADDLEAYKLADEFELKAMKFYKEKSNQTDNELIKKFYDFLYKMEYQHHQMLDSAILYLENPEDWFQFQEKWVMEG